MKLSENNLMEEYYGCIYKITNLDNGKIYIGKTTKTVDKRWQDHIATYRHYVKVIERGEVFEYSTRLYSAMYKHGTDKFYIEPIYILQATDNINLLEQEYIKKFDATNAAIGYNISPGGMGGPLFQGHRHSEKSKAIISKKSEQCVWWTNGKEQHFCKDCPCKGYYRGRIFGGRKFIPVINLTRKKVYTDYKSYLAACTRHYAVKSGHFVTINTKTHRRTYWFKFASLEQANKYLPNLDFDALLAEAKYLYKIRLRKEKAKLLNANNTKRNKPKSYIYCDDAGNFIEYDWELRDSLNFPLFSMSDNAQSKIIV